MEIRSRGQSVTVEIVPEKLKVKACRSCEGPIKTGSQNKVHELKAPETLELDLKGKDEAG
jgi:hypothetical protein